MGEDFRKIKWDEGAHIGIDFFIVLSHIAIGKVNLLVCEVVNDDLKIAWVQTWHNCSDCDFSSYLSISLL